MFDQIQCYFTVNKLTTVFQHAYREGYLTSTELTQMTDWLSEIDDKKIGGLFCSDFSVAFDIIDHSLLLEKHMCYGFTTPAILWIKRYLSNRTHNPDLQHNPGRIRNSPGQLSRPLTFQNL